MARASASSANTAAVRLRSRCRACSARSASAVRQAAQPLRNFVCFEQWVGPPLAGGWGVTGGSLRDTRSFCPVGLLFLTAGRGDRWLT